MGSQAEDMLREMLVKGINLDDWKIKGIANTGKKDLVGDRLALDTSNYGPLLTDGKLNWCHLSGDENEIGIVTHLELMKMMDGSSAMVVDGVLYPTNKIAQGIQKDLKKGEYYGLSVEGSKGNTIRNSDGTITLDGSTICKTAFTRNPCDQRTQVWLDRMGDPLSIAKAMEAAARASHGDNWLGKSDSLFGMAALAKDISLGTAGAGGNASSLQVAQQLGVPASQQHPTGVPTPSDLLYHGIPVFAQGNASCRCYTDGTIADGLGNPGQGWRGILKHYQKCVGVNPQEIGNYFQTLARYGRGNQQA